MKLPSITATRAVAFISVIDLLGLMSVQLTGMAKAKSDSGYLPFETSTLVTPADFIEHAASQEVDLKKLIDKNPREVRKMVIEFKDLINELEFR